MNSSYKSEDVVLLLKDITGEVSLLPGDERERLIQSGRHYSEMLPIEYVPTKEYMDIYFDSLKVFGQGLADAIAVLSEKILKVKGEAAVPVSLARAGTPIGILVKRYIKWRFNIDMPHYSISIIRGRGIDKTAMKYLLNRYRAEDILFIDGWIGKGAILEELKSACAEYDGLSSELAVASDPAGESDITGTYEDIFIPSSALNSTVCGLISRTFLRDDIIGENDFHGAVYYKEYENEDLSYHFIESIEKLFRREVHDNSIRGKRGIFEAGRIAAKYNIRDINLIKPGIGETTRVLLRRVPWRVLIDERYADSKELLHIKRLAQEKSVEIEYTKLSNYKCVGIIKKLTDV